jgi:cytochrome c oxidase cbb3-type subunit 2
MTLNNFLLGLIASFGIAWLAVVVVPFFKMRAIEPIVVNDPVAGTTEVFIPKRAGRVTDGSQVYAANGCYLCHTQVVRPTYAGNDLFRPDWGGLAQDEERGDTRRETNAFDFMGEPFAHIGVMRFGPDLSNVGNRVIHDYAKGADPEMWLYQFLHDPRAEPGRRHSKCPSHRFLFTERPLRGHRSRHALPAGDNPDVEILPTPAARALVSYLLSLRKDQPVPEPLNFKPVARSNDG